MMEAANFSSGRAEKFTDVKNSFIPGKPYYKPLRWP